MAEPNEKNKDPTADIDSEKPSTLKSGLQRWFLVAGVMLTGLFAFLFYSMSAQQDEDDKKEAATALTAPENVTDGIRVNQNTAISRFNNGIGQNSPNNNTTDKILDQPIKKDYAPRKTASYKASTEGRNSRNNRNKGTEEKEKSAYQKYIELEQSRVYQSLASKSTIGEGTFYKTNNPIKSDGNQQETKETITNKQAKLRVKIKALREYRKAVQNGEIDASTTPPNINELFGGEK
ncbi:MAG: hypothetical protein HRU24_13135 [Gammaproteobacteria bacterium]|nr:hypothetical protein [Gammaproteobacteria bacterium]